MLILYTASRVCVMYIFALVLRVEFVCVNMFKYFYVQNCNHMLSLKCKFSFAAKIMYFDN